MRESLLYFRNLEKAYLPLVDRLMREKPSFLAQLEALNRALMHSKEAFREKKSFAFCADCAKKGIKCCSRDLEWKLRAEEFFLNLCLFKLNGETLILQERSTEDCLFLGEKGCILKLTPLFCRNFFCRELSEFLGRDNLIYLQNILEKEVVLSFNLCEEVKKFLPKGALNL